MSCNRLWKALKGAFGRKPPGAPTGGYGFEYLPNGDLCAIWVDWERIDTSSERGARVLKVWDTLKGNFPDYGDPLEPALTKVRAILKALKEAAQEG